MLPGSQLLGSDLRVRQMHRIHVGGVPRTAAILPERMVVTPIEADDLYPGRRKATLRFFLPRGSYATLLVKRLCLPPARCMPSAETTHGSVGL